MDYCITVKGNELALYTATWVCLKNSEKATCKMIHVAE